MNALQQILSQARERGITLRLDGDNLKISGEYTDKFLTWASRRKAELIAELRSHPSLDELLDQARAGTPWTLKEARNLFAPLDLQQIVSGELSPDATRHFLETHARRTCRKCLGGGCRQCDFYGTALHTEETST